MPPKEPGHQCPSIDTLLDDIKSITHDLDVSIKGSYEMEDLTDAIGEASWAVDNLTDPLEDLRKGCEALREWGHAWKEKAEEYEEELLGVTKQ